MTCRRRQCSTETEPGAAGPWGPGSAHGRSYRGCVRLPLQRAIACDCDRALGGVLGVGSVHAGDRQDQGQNEPYLWLWAAAKCAGLTLSLQLVICTCSDRAQGQVEGRFVRSGAKLAGLRTHTC